MAPSSESWVQVRVRQAKAAASFPRAEGCGCHGRCGPGAFSGLPARGAGEMGERGRPRRGPVLGRVPVPQTSHTMLGSLSEPPFLGQRQGKVISPCCLSESRGRLGVSSPPRGLHHAGSSVVGLVRASAWQGGAARREGPFLAKGRVNACPLPIRATRKRQHACRKGQAGAEGCALRLFDPRAHHGLRSPRCRK